MPIKRRMKSIPPCDQPFLFEPGPPEPGSASQTTPSLPGFVNPPRTRLYFGDLSFEDHLIDNGFGWIVRLAQYLDQYDWSSFEAQYHPSGRQPLHPKLIMGLILYGFMEGVCSLRGLEKLSAKDLGANYLSAGQIPDHSTIGKFILRHEDLLSEEFFQKTLQDIAQSLHLKLDEVSGDGTVIEARASHYKTLKKEAMRGAAEAALRAAEDEPESSVLVEKAERLSRANQELQRRAEEKRKKGKDASQMQISPLEPEAVIQPLKNKACRPSYKPIIFSSPDRFIASQTVIPSNEAAGALALLETYQETTGEDLRCVLFDAGFHTSELLGYSVENNLDILTPSGRADRDRWRKQGREGKKFVKHDFRYDAVNDVYVCPHGFELPVVERYTTASGESVRRYRCGAVGHCPQPERCTDSSRGRTIKRYDFDELKEAMDQVMEQPGARRKYKKRQGMVEPVFGYLRGRQQLSKFHRFGLCKVRLEFALHVVAYNLKRAFKVFGMMQVEAENAAGGKKTYLGLLCFISIGRSAFLRVIFVKIGGINQNA